MSYCLLTYTILIIQIRREGKSIFNQDIEIKDWNTWVAKFKKFAEAEATPTLLKALDDIEFATEQGV